MPIFVVSDLHGACEDLRGVIPPGATLILLGDLVNLLDYQSRTGILYDVFTPEAVDAVSALRARGDFDEARRVIRERAAGRDEEIRAEIRSRIDDQYAATFDALPDPTYLILGNVDSPALAKKFAQRTPAVVLADAGVFELDGERFGFVGGALPTPFHAAGEITDEEMESKVASLGEVDVLCSHIPPAIPELCYDTLASRSETGSSALLEYILEVQPRCAYFGHVHQPLLSSLHVGRTLCVNVGYFRATKRAWAHGLEDANAGVLETQTDAERGMSWPTR